MDTEPTFTTFEGHTRRLTASLAEILTLLHAQPRAGLLTFDDRTGRSVDFDLSGTLDEVLARHAPETPRTGPGRPKLGVVSREVSLLPRHWEWLERQRGGASAALRRLIDEARQADPDGERRAQAQAATDRFLGAVAGDLPGYEEATRALYAADRGGFEARLNDWPEDVRQHALFLAAPAFTTSPPPSGVSRSSQE
ncbi:DUF2239 family protein [Deinococcus sp. 23YEL01]|uniref:DUF2239 family protein n=2 Tax=unclassified Deinococcus TaxID=2623546 RepID=UPI001E56D419|nr:DUF2239 family protein [Deinococcus sp. 23YEL01]MCD0168966.1 DUF2239 family protein [Deinococcus sp. 23YEL01]